MKGDLYTMKIICSKSNLLQGINIVSRAVSSHSTLNILECILIEVSPDEIKLTANDMELGIETTIVGDIEENGRIALNAKLFSEIIRKLPDNNVTIETDEYNQAFITCEKAKFKIAGKSGEDFPALPEVEKDSFFTISQFALRNMIMQTIFSISDNDNNKMMTGESLIVNHNKLRIASLDGHRISIRYVDLKDTYNGEKKIVIPGKTLSDISKIVTGNVYDEVNIFITDKHVLFEFDRTRVVSRLIEGDYFNIDQMLTDDYETKIEINKSELLNCIDRATLLVRDSDSKPIILNIEGNNMELDISSDIGSMREDIESKKEGKDIRIGFNPKFLMDVLKVIDDETVSVYFVNHKAPCFIKNENKDYIYIILPVNISE